jgi:mannose-6-phosphate isomerase-like protein (cupin superfamily)
MNYRSSTKNRFIKKSQGLLIVLTAIFLGGFSQAQSDHAPMNASDIVWGPAPDFFPAGAEFALLNGNPAEAGLITLRLKFPAGYEVPAHWHPTVENVTVLSGTFYVGMGDTLDKTNSMALEVGGFAAVPANHNHFAWTEEETIVQVHLMGPFAITYVNPADDPRNE